MPTGKSLFQLKKKLLRNNRRVQRMGAPSLYQGDWMKETMVILRMLAKQSQTMAVWRLVRSLPLMTVTAQMLMVAVRASRGVFT